MIPSLLRRCPACGHVASSPRFAVVRDVDGPRLVECPRCGHRFRAVADPRLK